MLTLSVSSCRVEEKVNEKDKGDISSDDDDGRIYRIHDDGESGLFIRADAGRRVSRSKETIHFFSHDTGETVGGYIIVGYMSHTNNYSSQRGDNTGDIAKQGIRSQEFSNYSFQNVR